MIELASGNLGAIGIVLLAGIVIVLLFMIFLGR